MLDEVAVPEATGLWVTGADAKIPGPRPTQAHAHKNTPKTLEIGFNLPRRWRSDAEDLALIQRQILLIPTADLSS